MDLIILDELEAYCRLRGVKKDDAISEAIGIYMRDFPLLKESHAHTERKLNTANKIINMLLEKQIDTASKIMEQAVAQKQIKQTNRSKLSCILYKMELMDKIYYEGIEIMRVPGGWIYRYIDINSAVFVGMDDEFEDALC